MEFEPDTQRQIERMEFEGPCTGKERAETIPHVITAAAEKIHRDKEPLYAGKEEAIEHRSDFPQSSSNPHQSASQSNVVTALEGGNEAGQLESFQTMKEEGRLPRRFEEGEDQQEEEEEEEGDEEVEEEDTHDESIEEARGGEPPQDERDEEREEEKQRMKTEKFPQFVETSSSQANPSKQKSEDAVMAKDKSRSEIPPPPPIEGLQERKRAASGHLFDSKPTVASMRPGVRQPTETQASTMTQDVTEAPSGAVPGTSISSSSLSSSGGQIPSGTTPSSTSGTSLPSANTAESKKMDMKFEVDVLRMRLQAAIKSRDEVLTRWATHEALRDRNLVLLEQIRRNVMQDMDELSNRTIARDYAMNVENECRRKLDEAHASLVRFEHERAECEARHLGERQMCSELERRIRDHTMGIDHSMALKQKREMEVQDLELKIRIRELEMQRTEVFENDPPRLYHPDYTSKVQVPTKLPPGANPTDSSQLPMISTQSVVSMETPLSEEEITKAALKHSVPLPSNISAQKQAELQKGSSNAPPTTQSLPSVPLKHLPPQHHHLLHPYHQQAAAQQQATQVPPPPHQAQQIQLPQQAPIQTLPQPIYHTPIQLPYGSASIPLSTLPFTGAPIAQSTGFYPKSAPLQPPYASSFQLFHGQPSSASTVSTYPPTHQYERVIPTTIANATGTSTDTSLPSTAPTVPHHTSIATSIPPYISSNVQSTADQPHHSPHSPHSPAGSTTFLLPSGPAPPLPPRLHSPSGPPIQQQEPTTSKASTQPSTEQISSPTAQPHRRLSVPISSTSVHPSSSLAIPISFRD